MAVREHIKSYLLLLLQPWKVITFLFAYMSLLAGSLFAGDPTWDFFSVTIMSFLTFLFAPWCLAIWYFSLVERKITLALLLSLFAWLFSASLSYDLYVFIKTGYSAEATIENFLISSVLFILAGFFWSLSFNERQGLHFEFSDKQWPRVRRNTSVFKILLMSLPLLAVYGFLLWRLISEK